MKGMTHRLKRVYCSPTLCMHTTDWQEPRIAYRHKNEGLTYTYYSQVFQWLFNNYKAKQRERALDLGCGRGFIVKFLRALGYRDSIGLDISANLVKQSKQNDVKIVVADAVKTPFKTSSFDIVTCFETLEHIIKPESLVREAYRLLKTDGVFIITTPIKNPVNLIIDFLRGERTHISIMTIKSLTTIMGRYFQKLNYYTIFILPIPPPIFDRYFYWKTQVFGTHIWMFGEKKKPITP